MADESTASDNGEELEPTLLDQFRGLAPPVQRMQVFKVVDQLLNHFGALGRDGLVVVDHWLGQPTNRLDPDMTPEGMVQIRKLVKAALQGSDCVSRFQDEMARIQELQSKKG